MTIYYPDVSNNNPGLRIQPATVAVCAKASEGRTFTDSLYTTFRAQSAVVGAFFFAYHWLHHGNIDAQAAHCYSIVGNTPVMIDCEDTSDVPTVNDCIQFAQGMRSRGGVCTLVYLPHWYWQNNLKSPDLRPLNANGLRLVSSDYTTYSDTGPGWAPYGGVSPVIWQYTDSLPYGGQAVDFNAYRGTVAELAALVGGAQPAQPEPPEPPPVPEKEYDMIGWLAVDDSDAANLQYYLCNGFESLPITEAVMNDLAYLNATTGGKLLGTGDDAVEGNPVNAWLPVNGYGNVLRRDWQKGYMGPVRVTGVDPEALAAALAPLLPAGLTADEVTAACVAALAKVTATTTSTTVLQTSS